jgi:predicted O-methyltransferase YrrM
MNSISSIKHDKIETTLNYLYKDSKRDYLKIVKGVTRSVLREMRPDDFEDAYLSITKSQGQDLVNLIKSNNVRNIVEFGTSFGISTLFLAQGILGTNGHIITTELIVSKAQKAIENFQKAGVNHLIKVKIGNAMETLKGYSNPIDLLLLDGWNDLYLPLFKMLEPNFHKNSIIYVDNANMEESKDFLKTVSKSNLYLFEYKFKDKVVLISLK